MNKPPDITKEDIKAYKQILMAARLGRLGIISCVYKGTGKPVMVLVAKNPKEDGNFDLVPFGTMFTEDPADFIETPDGFGVNPCNHDNDNNISIAE